MTSRILSLSAAVDRLPGQASNIGSARLHAAMLMCEQIGSSLKYFSNINAILVSLHFCLSAKQASSDIQANKILSPQLCRSMVIVDSLISESIEYYGALCESTFQSKCLSEQELTSLPLMSGNIISSVVQYNGAIVFPGEGSLSVKDRKEKGKEKMNRIKVNAISVQQRRDFSKLFVFIMLDSDNLVK